MKNHGVARMALAGCLAATLTGCGVLGELAADQAVITASQPFRGSPAEKFAEGIGGIVVPEARPVKNFSAKDVRSAFLTSRRMLGAAHLDRRTLLGGKPEAFAELLDAEQRKFFLRDLDHKDQKKNTRSWVTSFAPGSAELVGEAVKVQGKMAAESAVDEDGGPQLRVNYEARFVYALRPAAKSGPIVRVMVYVKARHEFWRDEPGARLRNWDGESVEFWSAGTECESPDGFLRPDYTGEGGGGGPVDDAYDDKAAPLKEGECGTVDEV
ncbi:MULTISPECIES: hypothetical protein [Streptosporangium]|uniref:Lipoprotein n=1 Tax=Streptosporangium brasiliense TaxID=47480 RepID=A0ABT9RN24_9ACTN|nr:hypothetical protein [Streptosporangium brasiliense]MDP9869770.1 hypothetical protein [Streptosporangium brasiliense]